MVMMWNLEFLISLKSVLLIISRKWLYENIIYPIQTRCSNCLIYGSMLETIREENSHQVALLNRRKRSLKSLLQLLLVLMICLCQIEKIQLHLMEVDLRRSIRSIQVRDTWSRRRSHSDFALERPSESNKIKELLEHKKDFQLMIKIQKAPSHLMEIGRISCHLKLSYSKQDSLHYAKPTTIIGSKIKRKIKIVISAIAHHHSRRRKTNSI